MQKDTGLARLLGRDHVAQFLAELAKLVRQRSKLGPDVVFVLPRTRIPLRRYTCAWRPVDADGVPSLIFGLDQTHDSWLDHLAHRVPRQGLEANDPFGDLVRRESIPGPALKVAR